MNRRQSVSGTLSPTSGLRFPLLRHLGTFLLVIRTHGNLALLAAVPGSTAISATLGWYTSVIGTVGIGAGLVSPVRVARNANIERPQNRKPHFYRVTFTAGTSKAAGALEK